MKGLLFTIVGFFFILLLAIAYFSKKSNVSIRIKLYRYLLIAEILLLGSEIISSLLIIYISNSFIPHMLLRFHWYTAILWFCILYYYSIVSIDDIKNDSFWDIVTSSKKSKIIFGILLFGNIVFFFIPFGKIHANDSFSYLPGYAAYFIYFFGAIIIYLLLGHMILKRKTVRKNTIISIVALIVTTHIVLVLQIINQTLAIQALGTALHVYLLYFTIENPDLELISQIENSKKEIDQSSKAKTDFLSNMSHEIRTPMNAIIGFSESLISDDFDEETVRNEIMSMNDAGNNLLDIINKILDISKIETGKESLEKKEYNISNILKELHKIVESRIETKPIKYIENIDDNIPSKLYGDSVKLFQILLNILTNSVKYTEVGKIILYLKYDINNDDAVLHFKISDTGYGIKKEDYDKLFEKFTRLDEAINKEIEGTGLGLLITKKYVDLMGGKIWFDSKYQVGTNFYVDLPQKIIDKTPIKDVKANKNIDEIEWIDCSAYKVLLVDDNKLNLKVAHKLLSKYHFQITEANGGKECLDLIKSNNEYDLIFLDHMMPDIDGIEVLHILKDLDGYKVPPVVALTANALSGMKENYLKEGFDDYLSKPINITELNRVVIKYFSK